MLTNNYSCPLGTEGELSWPKGAWPQFSPRQGRTAHTHVLEIEVLSAGQAAVQPHLHKLRCAT